MLGLSLGVRECVVTAVKRERDEVIKDIKETKVKKNRK